MSPARLLSIIEASPLRPDVAELLEALPDVPAAELAAALETLYDAGQIAALPEGTENLCGSTT